LTGTARIAKRARAFMLAAMKHWFKFLLSVLAASCLFPAAGCATKIDWNGRVGMYTLDQAIAEMGPPDKSAKLTDGTTVAEWLTERNRSDGQMIFMGGPGWRRGGFWGPAYVSTGPDFERFLRLTFDPDGRMIAWKNVTK
jgi:hypothetical protein